MPGMHIRRCIGLHGAHALVLRSGVVNGCQQNIIQKTIGAAKATCSVSHFLQVVDIHSVSGGHNFFDRQVRRMNFTFSTLS